jgi:hypothetical protein
LAEVVPDVRVVEQPNLGLVGFAHIAFVAPLVDKVDQQLLAVASQLLFEVRLEGGTLESTNARKKCENVIQLQHGPTVQKARVLGGWPWLTANRECCTEGLGLSPLPF